MYEPSAWAQIIYTLMVIVPFAGLLYIADRLGTNHHKVEDDRMDQRFDEINKRLAEERLEWDRRHKIR